ALPQLRGDSGRLGEVGGATAIVAGCHQGPHELVTDVNALDGGRALGKVLKRLQRLLQTADRLVIRRTAGGLQSRLVEISESLVPELGTLGVMSEPFDSIARRLGTLILQRRNNTSMQGPAPLR